MYNLFVSGYRRRVKFETQYDPEAYLEKQSAMPAQDAVMEFSDMQRAMNQLNRNYRNIITLTCIEGRRYQEVSEILGIPIGTVRSRLSRARTQLQIAIDNPSDGSENPGQPNISPYIASHALRQRA